MPDSINMMNSVNVLKGTADRLAKVVHVLKGMDIAASQSSTITQVCRELTDMETMVSANAKDLAKAFTEAREADEMPDWVPSARCASCHAPLLVFKAGDEEVRLCPDPVQMAPTVVDDNFVHLSFQAGRCKIVLNGITDFRWGIHDSICRKHRPTNMNPRLVQLWDMTYDTVDMEAIRKDLDEISEILA